MKSKRPLAISDSRMFSILKGVFLSSLISSDINEIWSNFWFSWIFLWLLVPMQMLGPTSTSTTKNVPKHLRVPQNFIQCLIWQFKLWSDHQSTNKRIFCNIETFIDPNLHGLNPTHWRVNLPSWRITKPSSALSCCQIKQA